MWWQRKTRRRPASGRAPPVSGESFRPRWRYALIIFLLALGYRGIYLWEASKQPDFDVFYMDQEYHLGWAGSLASGEWAPPYDQLQGAPYFRAPLYAYFLAAWRIILGPDLLWPRILQIIIGAVSCALAYAVGTKCFGQRVGLLGGAGCALYWVLAYFDGEFLLPVLLVFLLLLALWLTFVACERRSYWLAGLAGLTLGLYAITRPNILAFYPLAWWWCFRTMRGQGRLRNLLTLFFALGCLLPPSWVTVRNRIVGGDWVVVASQGGVNFYIGNNPQSNGTQAVVPGTRQTWWGGFEDTRRMAEQAAGRPLSPSEVSRYWYGRAWAYIGEQPGHWVKLTWRKVLALIGDVELSNNEPYEARRNRYWSFRLVPLSFALVLALFLVALPQMLWTRGYAAGLAAEERRLRLRFVSFILQLVLVYSLSVIAFFVTGRYRVPLLPLFMMGAALTLVSLLRLITARRPGPAIATAAAALVLFAVLRVDFLDAREATRGFALLSDAQDRLQAGDTEGAIVALETIRREQSVRAPEVYKTLVRAYLQRNRPGDKELLLRAALDGAQRYPDDAELLWYVVVSHVEAQNWPAADGPVERYLRLRPDDVRGLYLAFQVALRLGRPEEAAAHLARAQALDPADPLVAKMRDLLARLNQQPPPR